MKALGAALLSKMAADNWSEQKVTRTARGQEGGSGRGQTEDAPEQQELKATGNPVATRADQQQQEQAVPSVLSATSP